MVAINFTMIIASYRFRSYQFTSIPKQRKRQSGRSQIRDAASYGFSQVRHKK
ncbi:hypothetical protein U1Q18_025647, partial [Sarracenia purpurea var. burkii]